MDTARRSCMGCTHLVCTPDGFGGMTCACEQFLQLLGIFGPEDPGSEEIQEDCRKLASAVRS